MAYYIFCFLVGYGASALISDIVEEVRRA